MVATQLITVKPSWIAIILNNCYHRLSQPHHQLHQLSFSITNVAKVTTTVPYQILVKLTTANHHHSFPSPPHLLVVKIAIVTIISTTSNHLLLCQPMKCSVVLKSSYQTRIPFPTTTVAIVAVLMITTLDHPQLDLMRRNLLVDIDETQSISNSKC